METVSHCVVHQGFPDSSVGKASACNAEDWFDPWVGRNRWRRNRLPTPVFLGFPCGSAGKEYTCNAGDLDLIPGLGRSPEEGKATHSSIVAWRILLYSPWDCKELDMTEQLLLSLW